MYSPRLEDSRKSNQISLASTRCKLESPQISSVVGSAGGMRQAGLIRENSHVARDLSRN